MDALAAAFPPVSKYLDQFAQCCEATQREFFRLSDSEVVR